MAGAYDRVRCLLGGIGLALVLLGCSINTAKAVEVGNFDDVKSDAYYFESVEDMHNKGLISGKSDRLFHPNDIITNAELIKIISNIENISQTNEGETWYYGAIKWAEENGIWKPGIGPNASATRGELCAYIATYYQIDTSNTDKVFYDCDFKCGEALYELGIVYGIPTEQGIQLSKNSNITRADACVILDRAIRTLNRSDGNHDIGYYLYDIKEEYSPNIDLWNGNNTPTSKSDFESIWLYLQVTGQRQLDFSYEGLMIDYDSQYKGIERNLVEGKYVIERLMPEYAYYEGKYKIQRNKRLYPDGFNKLTSLSLCRFSQLDDAGFDEVIRQQRDFDKQCEDAIFLLFRKGIISNNMSNKDMLERLFRYVSLNYAYDYSFKNKTGYDMITYGKSTCSGFTAVYSGMAHKLGIRVEGYTGTSKLDNVGHILLRYSENGREWVYIDPTFGDDVGTGLPNMDYFWMSQSQVDKYMTPDSWVQA